MDGMVNIRLAEETKRLLGAIIIWGVREEV